MLKKLTLVAGFGAGYVLGAKAGTQRYEEIVAKAREIAGMPAVQNATAQVQDTAGSLAASAKETVNDKVSQVSDATSSSSDPDLPAAAGAGAATGSRAPGARPTKPSPTASGATKPRGAGAAPSATAPIPRP